MVRTDRSGVAGNSVSPFGRNPLDRGWHQDRLRTSTVDRLPGVPKAGDPNRLDLGQTRQRTQRRPAAIGFVDLCPSADPSAEQPYFSSETVNLARWRSCASWINGIGSMFCARKGIRGSGWMKAVVGTVRQLYPAARSKHWLGRGC